MDRLAEKKNDDARPASAWSKVTMSDVAREANVSTATVSRFLDGMVPVLEPTRAKVMEAIKKTGYIRNEAATRLARGTSDTVGLLIRDPNNPYYGILHSELQLGAAEHKLHLLTVASPPGFNPMTENFGLRRLLEQRVGGILVATGTIAPDELSSFVRDVPTVVLGRPEEHPTLNTVSLDEVANARLIVDAVLSCGHKDIVVTFPETNHSGLLIEHLRGTWLTRHLREAGANVITVDTPSLASADIESTHRQVIDLVRDQQVTAALFTSDMKLLGFLKAAQEAGIRVPEDVSATGFDGLLPGTELLGLATVRLPVEALARRGMEIIHEEMVSDARLPVRHESLVGSFLPGRTLAARPPQ